MTANPSAARNTSIDGDTLRRLVEAGAHLLEEKVDAVNALNVFPVPDGDTGINMLLTIREALASPDLPTRGTGTVGQVSNAIARAALLRARGNSGVILSQFLKGFAAGLGNADVCDGQALKAALRNAADSGYQAVGKPVEGTMLTVMRAAADGAATVDGAPAAVLRAALDAAQEALRHTPEQLPILAEAGVVDAGGQGVVVLLAGAVAKLEGVEPALDVAAPAGAPPTAATAVSHDFLEHTEEEMYGYCTQFVVRDSTIDVDALRQRVMAIAGSTVVVGDEAVARVHAHALDPGPLLSLGASVGALEQIKIENMDTMHREFMARHGYAATSLAVAVVAVSPGPGLERVFQDLGAAVTIRGGQTMNPSAADILDAVQRAGAQHTVILPNNSNVIMAARQAAELAPTACSVIATRNVPQGVAALLAFNPDLDADGNVRAMTAALEAVRSGEVTIAVRSTSIDGVAVEEGQAIGLLDDKVVCARGTAQEALGRLLDSASLEDGALVTLYWGADVDETAASLAASSLRDRWPNVEFEVVDGGQPYYHYLVSIE